MSSLISKLVTLYCLVMALQDYGVDVKNGKRMTLPDYFFIFLFLFYQAIDVREGEKAKTRDKRRDAHRL